MELEPDWIIGRTFTLCEECYEDSGYDKVNKLSVKVDFELDTGNTREELDKMFLLQDKHFKY